MYYEKLELLKPIPSDLTDKLLKFAQYRFSHRFRKTPIGNFETDDRSSLSYVTSQSSFESQYGVSGFIEICKLTDVLEGELKQCCQEYFDINNLDIQIQGLQGGNFFVPHVDGRSSSYFYILQNGGPTVTTVWYDVKDEFKHLTVTKNVAIPFDKIQEVDSCVIPESMWYKFSHETIHSVRNLEGLRIVLCLFLNH